MIARNMFYSHRKTRFVKKKKKKKKDNLQQNRAEQRAFHHEDEKDEEDEGGVVDRSQHWVCLHNLRELKVSQNNTELRITTQTVKKKKQLINSHMWELKFTSHICLASLHAGLKGAEIADLGSKYQVGQLSIRQEDDEKHDGEAHQVLRTAGHCVGQLTHGLVEVDKLEKLKWCVKILLLLQAKVFTFLLCCGCENDFCFTLTQEKKTMTAATWLNWTCRLAKDSKLGWDLSFSNSPLRRLPTMAVLAMFIKMAVTLNWKKARGQDSQPIYFNHKWNVMKRAEWKQSYVLLKWEHPDSSTGSWSNAAGGYGSPAPPPPRSTEQICRMPPRTRPQSSPSWKHISPVAHSGTARRSPRHQ